MIQKGIGTGRIVAVGKGEERILNHCKNNVLCSDVEYTVNKHVKFDSREKLKEAFLLIPFFQVFEPSFTL